MRNTLTVCIGLCLAAFVATSLPAAELTENLVTDGGMEQWNSTGPEDGWWNYLSVQWQAAQFARDGKGRILTPSITDQLLDTAVLRPESQDVHTGQKALRLKGQLYLRPSSQNAYKTRDGDTYLVRYWVKGEGQSLMYLHVYGDASAQILGTKGKPERERWSVIEERIQVTGRAPTTVYPRLWASDELLIDDVSVVRVIRPDERTLHEVPADLQARIAFASLTSEAIMLDGTLDEPAWRKAVPFAGFRSHGDQMLLAAVQPTFRVLFDEHALYFGVEVPLPNARQVRDGLQRQPLLDAAGQPLSKIDTFTGRHSLEFFLQAPGQSSYRQLVASLDGYRYDGTGMDASWNGGWTFAVGVADDRWLLELRVPAQDLGVEKVAPAEGWCLNLCCNQPSGSSTWAAVGNNFHSPDAFGELIAEDFAAWRNAHPEQLRQKRAAILQAAGPRAALYTDRLAALEAAVTPGVKSDASPDWEAITRAYAQMDFIGGAYRCVAEEVRYRGFFQ